MTRDLSTDPMRTKNVTATEMAALFGLNKYSSPAKMLENKINPTFVDNNHVRRGRLMEPAVLEAFLLDARMKTDRHEGGTHKLEGYRIAATPDAYVKGTNNVVEAKSIMSHTFERWYDLIPTHYHIQVLVQMLVMDSSIGYIGALEAGDPVLCEHRFIAWEVVRNKDIEELMKLETERFWANVDLGTLFRVDSKVKKRVLELLPTTSKLFIPTKKPEKVEAAENEEISRVLQLFQ